MKRCLFLILFPVYCLAEAGPGAYHEWMLEDALRVRLPEAIEYGVPFEAEIELLKDPAEPQHLEIRFNHLKNNGAFGRGLQSGGSHGVHAAATNIVVTLQLDETKDDLGLALLTLYFSPDRTWGRRTLQGNFPLLTPDADTGLYENGVAKASAQRATAPTADELGIPTYTPREEFFTQYVDDPGIRDWKPDPQAKPPLADIMARPPEPVPVYGVYSWAEEFARAAGEVEKIGFKTMRISGPWENAGEALRLAAEQGIEVLYTIMAAGGEKSFWSARRKNMETDEAFLASFTNNIIDFIKTFGPEGSYFADLPVKSPVKVIELFNEPNFHYLLPDTDNRKEDEAKREALYAQMITAGYDAVKAHAPDLKVAAFAAGGSGAGDMRFIEHILRDNPGIEKKMDIVTTHPYVMGAPPETQKYRPWGSYSIANNLNVIRGTLAEAGIPDIPIWYTELGWQFSVHHGGRHADNQNRISFLVEPNLHAAYLVRNYLWAMRLGIGRVHVMHLYDTDGYNGGFLVRNSLEWRPATHAVQNLIDLMPNPKLIGAQSDGEDNNYIYAYDADLTTDDTEQIIAAWNVIGPTEAAIAVDGESATVRVIDLIGNKKTMPVENGTVNLTIGPYPQFVIPLAR